MSVIFLNGCTSSGKSSIARALQARLAEPHLRYGIDDAFAMLPLRLHDHPDGFFFDTDAGGEIRLNHGAIGLAMWKAHARAAAAFALAGVGLILDEVVLEEELREAWTEALAGVDVFMVGVHCTLPELKRREAQRGDRLIGQAKGQLDLVHRGMHYDLEIDTTVVSPEDSADRIAETYERWRSKD